MLRVGDNGTFDYGLREMIASMGLPRLPPFLYKMMSNTPRYLLMRRCGEKATAMVIGRHDARRRTIEAFEAEYVLPTRRGECLSTSYQADGYVAPSLHHTSGVNTNARL